MARGLIVPLLLALALLGGCATRFPRPPKAHPDDPTDAQLEADIGHRSVPGGRRRLLAAEESLITCAAMRVILSRHDVTSVASECLPPEWSVDALAVGPTGQRARVEIAHHGGNGPYPWTGWNLWLVKGADGTWRVTGLWYDNIA